jgi:predicted nucleic acid-binding protein
MSVEAFFDTNVLVYAVSSSPAEASKRLMSEQLIANLEFGVSGQVLQEFYNTVTRKIARPISHEAAMGWLEDLSELDFVPVDCALVTAGAQIAHRFKTSYWDGAILAAAERLGAKTLYTEDLSHGQVYGTVTALNPYI